MCSVVDVDEPIALETFYDDDEQQEEEYEDDNDDKY